MKQDNDRRNGSNVDMYSRMDAIISIKKAENNNKR